MIRETREITSIGEWLSWRAGLLTASRIPALFAAHPYLSRDQLVAELRGQSQGSNAAMRRGRILEPAVAAAIAEERPDWLLRKATTFHLLPDHRLGVTPDYFAQEAFAEVGDGLINIQCKTVAPDVWEKWRGKPPLGYIIQTACENLVIDADAGVLAVMVCSPSYPLFLYDVPRHAAAEQRILDAASEFWRAWDKGEIAAPEPVADLAAMLDDGSHRNLSADNAIREMLAERRDLKAATKTAERRLGELDHQIKTRVGPASTAWLPGWNISFRAQPRKETVIPAATIRVLRIKEITEHEDG